MTNQNLRIINDNPEPEEEPKLRDRVIDIIDKHRKDLVAQIDKTIIYHTEMGATKLLVDDLPGAAANMPFVLKWLESQGFRIRKRHFLARAEISLLPED